MVFSRSLFGAVALLASVWMGRTEAFAAPILANSDSLPPPGSVYAAAAGVHRYGPVDEIQLRGSSHSGFIGSAPPPASVPGAFTVHDIPGDIEGDLFVNNLFVAHVFGDALMKVRVDFDQAMGSTRFFDTELLQLDVSGGNLPPGLFIRESPTLASLGRTTIEDVAGGLFRIDSFFDVFTELTLDGGVTWIPSNGSVRMELVPEPSSLLLLTGGILALRARMLRTGVDPRPGRGRGPAGDGPA